MASTGRIRRSIAGRLTGWNEITGVCGHVRGRDCRDRSRAIAWPGIGRRRHLQGNTLWGIGQRTAALAAILAGHTLDRGQKRERIWAPRHSARIASRERDQPGDRRPHGGGWPIERSVERPERGVPDPERMDARPCWEAEAPRDVLVSWREILRGNAAGMVVRRGEPGAERRRRGGDGTPPRRHPWISPSR